MLSVVTVDTALDLVDPHDQFTSLREAVEIANDLEGPDEIVFAFHRDNAVTITLDLGEFKLTDAVTITGPGTDLLTIDARNQSRIFNITASQGDFALNGLTLTNGLGSGEIFGWFTARTGGAIRSATRGMLTIDSSVISEIKGAGVYATGSVAVHASEILRNQGHGIIAHDATITSSTISDNAGKGISVSRNGYAWPASENIGRTVAVHNSTISGNHGGGIMAGSVTVSSSSIVGNSIESAIVPALGARWDFAGGIDTTGDILVVNSIVAANVRTTEVAWDDSFFVDTHDLTSWRQLGTVTVRHSLIGHNYGTELSEAPLGNPDSNGNLVGGPLNGVIDPRLAPLRDNGGPTSTHALLPDSPAVNMGDPSLMAGPVDVFTFDQRGAPYSRDVDGRNDMGSFERGMTGDGNGDGRVDFSDFLILSAHYGTGRSWSEGNFDGSEDGTQFADFLALSANFGFGVSNSDQSELVDALFSQFE